MLDKILSFISEAFGLFMKYFLVFLGIAVVTAQVGIFLENHASEIAAWLGI